MSGSAPAPGPVRVPVRVPVPGPGRLPYVLLIALSVVSFAGPIVIWVVVRGGASAKWPPDRPVEWAVIAAVMACFLLLFVACVSIRAWYRPNPS